jgi:hypothetical protein
MSVSCKDVTYACVCRNDVTFRHFVVPYSFDFNVYTSVAVYVSNGISAGRAPNKVKNIGVKRQIIICVTNIKLVQGILEFFMINSDWHVLEMLGKC